MSPAIIRRSLQASWRHLNQLERYIDCLPDGSKQEPKTHIKALSLALKELQEVVDESSKSASLPSAIAQNIPITNPENGTKLSPEITAKEIFPIISDLGLQLTADGTIIGCYVANTDDLTISYQHFLGWQIDRLLPSTVGREFLQAITQVRQTQQLTVLRYSLTGSEKGDRPEQFYQVKLIPAVGSNPSNGGQWQLEANARKTDGTENPIIAFICNITEQQQELEQLRQAKQDLETCLEERTYALRVANEQLWDTLFELQEAQTILEHQGEEFTMGACAGQVGIWDWNLKENKIYIDPMLKSLLGYQDQEIGNSWDDWQAKIYPEDVDQLKAALSDYGLGETSQFELEYRMFHKNGTIRWFFCRGSAINGEKLIPDRLICSNTDITEHKAIEEALQDSQERFRSIFNQAAIGMAQVALNGQYLQVNQKLCNILGYSQEQLSGNNFLDFVYCKDIEKAKKKMKALVKYEVQSYCLEQRYLRPNRELVWTDVTASLVRDTSGKPKYFIQVVQDITDRRKAEFALEYSETRYRAIVHDQTELVCRFLPDGTLTFVNDAYAYYFGQSYNQLIGTIYMNLLPQEQRQIHQEHITKLTPKNPVKTIEYASNKHDGEIYWQQWNIRGFFDYEGHLLECQGVGRDISDRVQAEAERDRFFSLSLDLLFIAGFDGYFKRINPAWTTTLGYDKRELLAQPLLEFIDPNDRAATIAEMQKLQQAIPTNYFENRYLCRNGSYKWIAWSIVPFPEEELLYGVGRDITAQKKVEAQIQASLEEKEVLFKEIHHRVKNNLQIVCSLLELQSHCSSDSEVVAMFKESQQRIRSMSLLHEILYQSNDLGHLNFRDYLQEISLNLCTSYGYSSEVLQIYCNPEHVFINLDTAIQCGLILNELLTNVFKYAFPDFYDQKYENKYARINIGIQALKNDCFLMIVGDNGIGLPANFQFDKTQTIGWRIIRALTRKLKGEIKVTSSQGTKVYLKFSKIKQRSARAVNR